MSPAEILGALVTWTPYLAGGFLMNILVSLLAMAIGTTLGFILAWMRLSPRRGVVRFSLTLTSFTRNVPTFVVLFYLAFILPVEFNIAGTAYSFPGWLKASLALSVAVTGFVSDNLTTALRHWRDADRVASLLFISNWTVYFVIIVMASSTASVIGVGEIVSRSNTVIAAVNESGLIVWIYLYAMLWFFLFCFPINLAMQWIKRSLTRRMRAAAKA